MDMIIKNAVIATMDKKKTFAEAAVIKDGRFVFVGKLSGALKYEGQGIKAVDFGGRLIVPGFNDSHMHYLHYVKSRMSVDLRGSKSLDDIVDRMKRGLTGFDPEGGAFLVGEGWNQDRFTSGDIRFPNAADLDRITTEYPIIVMRACYHVGALNHKAMEVMGLDGAKAASLGDYAEKDEAGEPTGVIKENYFDDVKSRLPYPSVEKLASLALAAQKDMFEKGVVAVQTDDVKYCPEGKAYEYFDLLRKASDDGRLLLTYSEQSLCETPSDVVSLIISGEPQKKADKFMVSAVKILSDGSLGARTAFLKKPYHDDPGNRGLAIHSQEELDEMVKIGNAGGLPVIIHAIGDGACGMCLKAFERSAALCGKRAGNGIVHCQITSEKQIRKFQKLGLTAYTQPIFIDYDMHIVADRVGKKLSETSYNWKRYMDEKIPEAFGTDCPVESFDPIPGIYCAVTRCDLSGNGPFLKKQRVSVWDAVRAYTFEGARASGYENIRGMIAAGYRADFAVLDRNIFEIKPKDILRAKVAETYIDGNRVY